MLADRTVIGVDVGFSSRRKSSAICRLDWSSSSVTWTIERFRAVEPERANSIARVAGGASTAAAAFDGPLRRSFDVIGRYRLAELMLTRRLQPLIGKPGQASAPVGKLLNEHANACAMHVLGSCDVENAQHEIAIDQKAVVEAFPSSFLGLMICDPARVAARRGDRSDVFFQHLLLNGRLQALLQHLLPNRHLDPDMRKITNHDDRAAFVCALTALCVVAGQFVAVGDDDGWIILPPMPFIEPVQRELLRLNEAEQGKAAIYVSSGVDAPRSLCAEACPVSL